MDKDPTIRVNMSFELSREDADWLIYQIGTLAAGEVRFGQGAMDMTEYRQKELHRQVTIQAARDFYHHGYEADVPSALATRVVSDIARALPDEALVKNERGDVTAIKREAWDEHMAEIFSSNSHIRLGPKSRDFLRAFNTWLHRVTEHTSPEA